MVQLQAICNILDNNNIEKYLIEGITAQYFGDYKDEFNFIYQHFRAYNKVPDLETFQGKYPNFDYVQVTDPLKYIIYNLKEEYLFNQGVKVLHQCSPILEQNAYAGLEAIIAQAQQLLQNNDIKYGVDIRDMEDEIIEDILRKKELNKQGIIGIPSGFEELDKITHGWLPGNELVTIVGRVNQGKSWLLLKFLTEASKQGKRVLMYTGEMGRKEIINRHMTLKYGISNDDIMTGNMSYEEIDNYRQLIRQEKSMYHIVTPDDLGENLTVTRLKMLALQYKPDIIGIDQLSIMEDDRSNYKDNTKEKYAHITQDLFRLSGLLEIPILLDAQANRGRTSENKIENPELSNIAGSDDVGANSSRVISLTTKDETIKLKLIKNRYGRVGWEQEFTSDFNKGEFNNLVLPLRNNNKNKDKYIDDVF